MLSSKFTLKDDFPPAGYDEWRAMVEADLKGQSFEQELVSHTHDGIDIQPLYTRLDELGVQDATGLPGQLPFVRGSSALGAVELGWDLREEHAHPDFSATNRAILEDLEGGVTSILLRLDRAACNGFDPDDPAAAQLVGRDGLMAYCVDDLDAALAGVDLSMVGIALQSGAAFLPAAATLVALWRRRGVSPGEVRGAFNADPLSALVQEGQLPYSSKTALSLLGDLAKWTSKQYPHVSAVGVDTTAYHGAGATAAQDIAFAIATAVEYLRAMTAAGIDVDTAARQISFTIGLGTHHFSAICKLRAARRLWSRVVEACGGSAASGAMRINAQTARRVLTTRDPYVNLLRNTVGVFAAALGGANSITSAPFDAVVGLPDEFSRRVARNTLWVLQEESHLHRVIDPAGGSWYLERLTQQFAEKAWEYFQNIERQGGMLQALSAGWVAKQIEAAHSARANDFAGGKKGIIGVSKFPDPAEQPLERSPLDLESLRQRAAARLAKSRGENKLLGALQKAAENERTSTAVDAASARASIGQMARALGFHAESTQAPPLPLRRFAEPFEQALRRDAGVKHDDQK